MNILQIEHISKRFGSHQVIEDLSLEVPEHTIYGFIGQNGSGKTTTMKMVLGLYPIDSGRILVNGEEVTYGETKTNRFIGYLPDVPEFYSYMTPFEYLKLCGEITGMSKSELTKEITELLEIVGLNQADKRIKGFSRGMKQRLGIAQALLNKPKLLICDEPTSALDPIGRKEIIDILESVKQRTTVIFSTHILSDVERISDEIGLLHDGRLALQTNMEKIRNKYNSDGFLIDFAHSGDLKHFVSEFQDMDIKPEIEGKIRLIYHNADMQIMHKAMQKMVNCGIYPLRIEMLEPTLENVFMEVVGQ